MDSPSAKILEHICWLADKAPSLLYQKSKKAVVYFFCTELFLTDSYRWAAAAVRASSKVLEPKLNTFLRKIIGVREPTKNSLAVRLRICGGPRDTLTPQDGKFHVAVDVNLHRVDTV